MATQKRFIAKNGLDNSSNSIINVANPTNAQDAATKSYVDALAGTSGNQRTVTTVTPTVGQTVFTIAYTVGYIDVFYNGVKLVLADDFVATNGTSVTLTNATIAGDVVEFVTYLNVALANTYTQTQTNSLFAPIASPTFTGVVTAPNSLLKVTTSSYPTIRPSLNLDFANSQSVDPRITFTRASTATRVRQDGLIEVVESGSPRIDFDPVTQVCKGLLIEEQRTNLITYSENFVAWALWRSFISVNVLIAPDGTLTATKLIEDTTISTSHTREQAVSFTSGTAYTFSMYVKAAERSIVSLRMKAGAFGVDAGATFNLTTLAITEITGTSPASTITSVGNSWYRISTTATATTTVTAGSYVALYNNSNNLVYTGDGTSGLYIWGAQLEAGAFPTSYIPSSDTFTSRASTATYIGSNGLIQSALTNVARYNYNPVNLALAPKLLLESASTNLLTYSEQFNNAAWTVMRATVTANSVISPDGTLTADTLICDTSTSTDHYIRYLSTGTTAGVTNTVSFYVKAKEITNFALAICDNTDYVTSRVSCDFNLSTETIYGNFGGGSNITSSIINVGNGWYRCIASGIAKTNSVGAVSIILSLKNPSITFTGDGTSGLYIWGAQLEAGSFPTSYIPTVASQVTRAADISSSAQTTRVADSAVMTGTNFSSWYSQTEGTVFTKQDFLYSLSNSTITNIDDGTGTYGKRLQHSKPLNVTTYTVLDNVNNAAVVDVSISGSGINNSCYTYKTNDYAMCGNGIVPITDSSGSVPTPLSRLVIGANPINLYKLNGHISKLSYYPKRLTDSELQALTTG